MNEDTRRQQIEVEERKEEQPKPNNLYQHLQHEMQHAQEQQQTKTKYDSALGNREFDKNGYSLLSINDHPLPSVQDSQHAKQSTIASSYNSDVSNFVRSFPNLSTNAKKSSDNYNSSNNVEEKDDVDLLKELIHSISLSRTKQKSSSKRLE